MSQEATAHLTGNMTAISPSAEIRRQRPPVLSRLFALTLEDIDHDKADPAPTSFSQRREPRDGAKETHIE